VGPCVGLAGERADNVHMLILDTAQLLAASVTVTVSVATLAFGMRSRIPARMFAVLGFGLIAVNTVVFGWPSAAGSLLAATVFLLGAALAGGALPRRTAFPLVITLMGLPWFLWWIPAAGIAIAGGVAAWRLRRVAGRGYVPMLAWETMAALGFRGGAIPAPDLSRMPRTDTEAGGAVGAASQEKIPLALFIIPVELLSIAVLAFFLWVS